MFALDGLDVAQLEQQVEQPSVRQPPQEAVTDLVGYAPELSGVERR